MAIQLAETTLLSQ